MTEDATGPARRSTRRRTFKVGDLVRIPNAPQPVFNTPDGTPVTWVPSMTAHVGKKAVVTVVDDDRTVRLDVHPDYWWAMDWLEPVGNGSTA